MKEKRKVGRKGRMDLPQKRKKDGDSERIQETHTEIHKEQKEGTSQCKQEIDP